MNPVTSGVVYRDGKEMSKELPGGFKKTPRRLPSGGSLGASFSVQKGLVPPVLQEVGKLAAGVATVASGSATGNPRNKHALQPGHSLMDWIRVGASGKDLTGVGDRAGKLSITPNQLAQHDKATDAWIAIRGKVYNVTQYLAFHPGGPDELMKGIGKDATSLFDQVHAWVNYEKLLQKCHLGRLVAVDPNVDTEELFFGKPTSPTTKESPVNNTKSPPKVLPPNKVSPMDDPEPSPPRRLSPVAEAVSLNSKEEIVLPRFDWIQKTDYITVIFYTKAFSNPQVEISPPNAENSVTVSLEYERRVFTNEIQFSKGIHWPGHVKLNYETGKVEVQFKKTESKIWENYGTLKQKCQDASAEEFKCKYIVLNKVDVNYNTFLLELQRVDETKLTVPIGRHVRVFASLQGEEVSRSYTPVPYSLFTKYKPQTFVTDNICLMIKSYPKGCVSKYVCSRKKGEMVEISKPLGSFSLSSIENRDTFMLFAAGTGITPMLGVLVFLLERRLRKCQNVTLLFFNRTEEDILVRSQLETLQQEDNRLKILHILSHPDAKWTGHRGHVSKSLLEEVVTNHLSNTVYTRKDLFTFICGPTPFTNLAYTLLSDMEFKPDQMHLFIG